MFNYKFTDSNTLELIDEELAPLSCKEPRPVYAGELNLLGFDKLFNYPHDCEEPLMWGEFNDYYYNGLRVAKLSGGDVNHAPTVRHDLLRAGHPVCGRALQVRPVQGAETAGLDHADR